MLNVDRNAVICDLAETYGIYNYRELPAGTVAALAAGLRDNSRIKLKLSGAEYPLETFLLASIADRLAMLLWARTKDGAKGRNRPKLITDALQKKNRENEVRGFSKSEDFELSWLLLSGGERIGS